MKATSFFSSLTLNSSKLIDNKCVLRGLCFRALEQDSHVPISGTLHAATKELDDIRIIEIKGADNIPQVIELNQEGETFCLAYQFIGNAAISTSASWQLKSGQHIGCGSKGQKLICRIDRGKTWLLLIVISGETIKSIYSEFPVLGSAPLSPFAIGYRQKHLFDKIQELKQGAYTFDIKIDYFIALLVAQYRIDLGAQLEAVSSADIALYYKAATYIQAHYMERKLTRQKIADALCVSVRTLTRSFEGKQLTISRAIQLARLHKAREWLRNGNATNDHLASELHFSDTPYFIHCYTALFKITPDEERLKRG